jgi:hypothetical protein
MVWAMRLAIAGDLLGAVPEFFQSPPGQRLPFLRIRPVTIWVAVRMPSMAHRLGNGAGSLGQPEERAS